MRICALHGRSGAGWYRMQLPLGELGRQPGFDVTFASSYGQACPGDIARCDVLAGQRIANYQNWRQAGWQGRKLVYEIDDDVFSVRPENRAAYADYQDRGLRDSTIRCLQASHLVTVTTPYLADVMRQYSRDVRVLPNCIPGWVLDHPAARPASPCLGWSGGDSHERDIALITRPVRKFLKRFPGWGLRLAGTDYRSLFRDESSTFTPWIPVWERPREYFRSLDFTVGLAPLLDNHFNRSKSPLRCLEYAACGIPVIASDVLPYRGFVQDGITGFLVRGERGWLERMTVLAGDRDLREKMGMAARQAAAEWTIERKSVLWKQAYEAVTR